MVLQTRDFRGKTPSILSESYYFEVRETNKKVYESIYIIGGHDGIQPTRHDWNGEPKRRRIL